MEFNVHNKYINRPRKDAPVNVILDYVMEQLSRFEFQEAEKYARLALQKDNKNTEIMDLLGEVLMGKGDFDRAKEVNPDPSLLNFIYELYSYIYCSNIVVIF